MITTVTSQDTYLTPWDTGVEAALVSLIDHAQTAVRLLIYGFTLPTVVDALIRAHQRGVDVRGVFDHSQSTDAVEVAQLHRLFLAVPPDQFRIGTSPESHQIVHLKCCYINYAETLAAPAPQQFATVSDAIDAGYPVTFAGSWNFSTSATKQANHVDITPGIDRAAAFHLAFLNLWSYISENEPQYQPITPTPAVA